MTRDENGDDDGRESLWAMAAKQAQDPWDWVFLIGGGAIGSVGTVASHLMDLGHSIPATALAAVALRRAVATSIRRPLVRKRALRLREVLTEISGCPASNRRFLDNYIRDFDRKLVLATKLEKQLRKIIEQKNWLIDKRAQEMEETAV